MEIQFPFLLILASLFIFFKLGTKFKPKNSSPNLPPGPWKLPLIGNLHNLIGSVPHRALHKLAIKYGPLMHLQVGEVSTVVVSSPEAAREVMKTQDINFASRPPILAAEILSYNCTSISFGPYGNYWRQLRKICTVELLSIKRVQSFRSLREQVFSDLARWIASMEGSPVNLTEKLMSSTYAFTVMASIGNITEKCEHLLPIIKEALGLADGYDIAELYPSISFFRLISRMRRRLSVLHREADRILDDVIRKHKEAYTVKSDESSKHEDLVDVLLKMQDDGLEIPLTTDNIKSVIMDVLAAGSETSATTMNWAMVEMLKNPNVMEKAQEELRRVFDEKGYIDESCIDELKYLKSVVKETLRMHPPLPLLLPRKCNEACKINGYEIPANTKIVVNAWAVNRDPQYWENANCFEPERFADSMVDYKGNHLEYIPFGAGRRICPGMSFGLANVHLPLGMMLFHFDWKLLEGIKHEEMDMTEGFGLTARRIQDLWVVPIVKRSLPVK